MACSVPVKLFGVLFCGFALGASTACAAAEADLAQRLKQAPESHPRLFFTDAQQSALKAKIDGDPLLRKTFEYLLRNAEIVKTLDPVKREKVGKRLLGVSRTCLQRVSYLAFAYRLTGDDTLLRRAEQEMLAAAAFEDWNPSHFLDVAEMTAALAIGYDWLYGGLAPDSRDAIRQAILEKGLKPGAAGGSWVVTTNNWNQVCHGGLVLGALAVLEDEPALARGIIARAIEHVPTAMHEYEPDGVYPEGPSYWEYGTTYNVLMIAALESVLGSDFGLASAAGFMKSPDFYLHAIGPTGLYFNFSDCGERGGISPALHWFAQRLGDSTLLWREQQELARFAAEQPNANGSADRMLSFLLIWGQPMTEIGTPARLHWKGDGRTPVAMFRSGWTERALYLGVKGGSPGTNHAHMDVGSFVLDLNGVRWAVDLGAQDYNGLEQRGVDLWNRKQESERWTVFRLNNLSHSTLVVNGQLQRVSAQAPITSFTDDPASPGAVVDMRTAYEGQLARAVRGVQLRRDGVLVQDEVQAPDVKARIRWGMVTHAQVESTGEAGTVTLHQAGEALRLRVLSPANTRLMVYEAEHPPRDHDAANPNTRIIGFETEVEPSAQETLAVLLEAGASGAEPIDIKPLKEW